MHVKTIINILTIKINFVLLCLHKLQCFIVFKFISKNNNTPEVLCYYTIKNIGTLKNMICHYNLMKNLRINGTIRFITSKLPLPYFIILIQTWLASLISPFSKSVKF
jgi:hypothetical protein